MISENVKNCIDNVLQPEPRKRWTIDKILDSDWIKMNRRLVQMNEQESLALIEAQKKKIKNKNQIKKIEANISDTQQILNKQLPKFFSFIQKIESTSNDTVEEKPGSNTSIYKLRRSARVLHAGNLLASKSNNK